MVLIYTLTVLGVCSTDTECGGGGDHVVLIYTLTVLGVCSPDTECGGGRPRGANFVP